MTKRQVPSLLQTVLTFDKNITCQICSISEHFAVTKSLKRQSKALEYSCHGVVWLACWLLFIWMAWYPSLFQMQVNFFIGLLLDIVIVAVLKAITRRRRPVGNKGDSLSFGPDKYSFPSGHVSRAFFIVYFFQNLYPVSVIFLPSIVSWAFAVSYSRILLRRHHLLDVLAGALVGFFEGILLSWIWLSQSSAFYLIGMITDERFEGADYDV